MTKIARIVSAALAGAMIVFLIFGNLFYQDFRKVFLNKFIEIDLGSDELAELKIKVDPDFDFKVFTQKDTYYPYERILVYAYIQDKSTHQVPSDAVIEVEFYNNGIPIGDVQGKQSVKLVYNTEQRVWAGIWYPGKTTFKGNVIVKAKGYLSAPRPPLETANKFYIDKKSPSFQINKGLSVIGIDTIDLISPRSILSPEGTVVDWNQIPRWVDFISADGIFMLGGVTATFDERTSLDSPWMNDKINESLGLAAKISQNGGKFGIWIKALKLEGSYLESVGYQPSWYLMNSKQNKSDSVVSLNDANRKKHIISLFSSFMNNESISYVGLSHMFSPSNYDIELFDLFVKEFQVAVPQNWDTMQEVYKFKYFVERMADPAFAENFWQWKNYVLSDYIKEIIKSSGHTKPVFYYAYVNEIKENPEILSVLFNSGVDFIVLNFDVNFRDIATTLDHLKNISDINQYFNRLLVSYEINFSNLDLAGYEISAIENYITANLQIAKYGSKYMNVQGILINDLFKAMSGNRGTYSPSEWMLGVGKTIYEFKLMNQNSPLRIDTFLNYDAANSNNIVLDFRIANISTFTIYNIYIHLLPVLNIENIQDKNKNISSLAPGKEVSLQIPITVKNDESQLKKKKQFVGVRISWAGSAEATGQNAKGFIDFLPIAGTMSKTEAAPVMVSNN
ncbi:MAG: hypothetical protein A2Y33_01280 [Spirochaetes bacterium GWF1_51_8]|nr:MAG: hypothetical protein A2Y33_01280 [Spirochaetes bacterium GWF1_51_8]